VKQGTVTETTQLISSYEACAELCEMRFDETGILTGASRLSTHSGMLTLFIRLRGKTEGGLSQLTNFFIFSKHLKVINLLFLYWDLSSAGEHMTEDHGVPGSTPGDPI
jgi:hypothetical protein